MDFPRIPLHLQNTEIAKAIRDANPSYESFRSNIIHPVEYKELEDRATTAPKALLKRHLNGELDIKHVGELILASIKKKEFGEPMSRVEESLLTVVFPYDYEIIEPHQARIDTQISDRERDALVTYVIAKMKEILNWNAGNGGGSVPGRSSTDVGG